MAAIVKKDNNFPSTYTKKTKNKKNVLELAPEGRRAGENRLMHKCYNRLSVSVP